MRANQDVCFKIASMYMCCPEFKRLLQPPTYMAALFKSAVGFYEMRVDVMANCGHCMKTRWNMWLAFTTTSKSLGAAEQRHHVDYTC